MDSKIICKWLGIEAWPPDHYALLGLKPGEGDVARLERQVQDRMAKLRCYQLAHPEEATEGMNRVAQAFIWVSESTFQDERFPVGSKKNKPNPPLPKRQSSRRPRNARADNDWKKTPPPVRILTSTPAPQAATTGQTATTTIIPRVLKLPKPLGNCRSISRPIR